MQPFFVAPISDQAAARLPEPAYAFELIYYLEYNILWKIPNNDNLNDAVVRRRKKK